MAKRRSLLTLGAVGAGAGAWIAAARADEKAIAADPQKCAFDFPLEGELIRVRSHDGTELNVRQFGRSDGPTLVLVHGWMCNLKFWTRQIQDLGSHLRIVAYDLRGHGESARAATNDYSIDAHADDLQAVLEAVIPAGRRGVVAGHSLGGMTIVAWAGRYPDLVSKTLAATALVNVGVGDLMRDALIAPIPAAVEEYYRHIAEFIITSNAPLTRSTTPLSYRIVRYVALSKTATPAQVAFSESQIATAQRHVRAACGRTLAELNLYDAFPKLTIPTLVIAGERDKMTPPVHAERIAAQLPTLAGLVRVENSGHMTPLSDSATVSTELLALMEAAGLYPVAASEDAVVPASVA
jgi:pimeloyl-ACP methyl ester carboxylesterase